MRLDPVYLHARRETVVIVVICLGFALWSLGVARAMGTGPLEPDQVAQAAILGIPTWVVWSLLVPWITGTLVTGWFCFFYLADDRLSEDSSEPQNPAAEDREGRS